MPSWYFTSWMLRSSCRRCSRASTSSRRSCSMAFMCPRCCWTRSVAACSFNTIWCFHCASSSTRRSAASWTLIVFCRARILPISFFVSRCNWMFFRRSSNTCSLWEMPSRCISQRLSRDSCTRRLRSAALYILFSIRIDRWCAFCSASSAFRASCCRLRSCASSKRCRFSSASRSFVSFSFSTFAMAISLAILARSASAAARCAATALDLASFSWMVWCNCSETTSRYNSFSTARSSRARSFS
mmetsp:Transcript_11085/g.19857  ORF Transcript_11085/g.19857 Transcript_11085/m.19857 type:complete len:243 (-) Transcript_11085:809-1537(-)